jgi:hypothetical protein
MNMSQILNKMAKFYEWLPPAAAEVAESKTYPEIWETKDNRKALDAAVHSLLEHDLFCNKQDLVSRQPSEDNKGKFTWVGHWQNPVLWAQRGCRIGRAHHSFLVAPCER